MPTFSARSLRSLSTCDDRLQALFRRVVGIVDCTVIQGHRSEDEQTAAYESGNSKIRWPNGKHNSYPSMAVDVAPVLSSEDYAIRWKELRRFYHFAGVVRGVAAEMGLAIRWGGDWDGDFDLSDNTFADLVHFELIEPRPDQPVSV